MPIPTIKWNVDADGDWATTADWDLDRLPNSTDDVRINTTDLHTVTHSTARDTVHTLIVGNDNFVVSGGSLTINSTSSFANLLTVSGGTLELDGAATVASFSQGLSTVSGAGTLTVTGPATFSSGDIDFGAQQNGPGTTVLQGASTVSSKLKLDGGRILENQGTLTLTGVFVVLGSSLGGGTLKNDAGGIIEFMQPSFIEGVFGDQLYGNGGA